MSAVATGAVYYAASWHNNGHISYFALPLLYLSGLSLFASQCSRYRPSGIKRWVGMPGKLLLLIWRFWQDMLQPVHRITHFVDGRTLAASPAQCRDLWELTQFDHLLFPKTSSRISTFLYLLRIKLLGNCTLFAVREASTQRIIGSVYLRPLRNAPIGFISNVGVHPEYQRKKLAQWMMIDLAIPAARQQGLGRLVLNVRERYVQQFYEKLGFQHYEGNGFDIDTPDGELPMFLNLSDKTTRLADRAVAASSQVS